MSILIKGQNLPKEGEHYLLQINSDGTVCDAVGRRIACIAVPVPPHGRLIDADEFLKRAIGTKCFRGDYALMLEELVGESATIIPSDPAEEGEG